MRRLRLFRLAYGSHYGAMDWSGAMQASEAMLADSKIEIAWRGGYGAAESFEIADTGKLALNMLLLAVNALPRGGQLDFAFAGEVRKPSITIRGSGVPVIIDDDAMAALASGCRREGAVLKDINARFRSRRSILSSRSTMRRYIWPLRSAGRSGLCCPSRRIGAGVCAATTASGMAR